MNCFLRILFPVLISSLLLAATAIAQERSYNMETVIVTPRKEDRAYRIMRKAIAMAPYYQNQVSEYGADVYLKGSLDVVKVSRLVRGLTGDGLKDFKAGETYLQESFNEIEFTAPDNYTQVVKRQMSNMPDGAGEMEESAMRLVQLNIYDPEAFPLIISPLSSGAFSHYRFRYEGDIEEDGRIINKIKVIPIRKSQQLVSGYIHVADDYWNVHEADLSGELKIVAGVKFRLQADYGKVGENVFMPTNHLITFDASLVGSKVVVRYISSIKYTSLVENTSIRIPDEILQAGQSGTQNEQNKDLSNRGSYRLARQIKKEVDAPRKESLDITEEFSDNYKVTVDTLAREPDPEFWDRVRPMALEPGELKGYRDRGISAVGQKDTTQNQPRRRSLFGTILTGGKPLRIGKSGEDILWRGIIPSKSGFNTIDGFYVGFAPLSYRKSFSATGKTTLTINPEMIWAINRRAVMWDVNASLAYSPMRRGVLTIEAGSISRDYAGRGGIMPLENTLASLLFRRNYLKMYEDNFVDVKNIIDISNGFTFSASLKYARRRMLENSSDYSFFYRKSREYTPNIPLPDHTAAILSVGVEYTPHYYYRIRNGRKQMVRSDYPTFFAGWQKGIKGLGGSVTDFDHISGGVRQNIGLGTPLQRLDYSVRAGIFVNKRSLSFPDFKQFTTKEIPLLNSSIVSENSFKLLEYYRYGTSDSYLEAHVSYQAQFLLLKLLPWFSDRLWQEGVQFNYLTTPELKNYMEIGYSLGLMWQAGVFVGFENFKYRGFGVKLSIPIQIGRRPR